MRAISRFGRPSRISPGPPTRILKKFYEDNRQIYTAPEYRSLAIMSIEPKDLAAKIQVSDADIASAYDAHKLDYFTPETRRSCR